MVILAGTCHDQNAKEGMELHQRNVLEGGVIGPFVAISQSDNFVVCVDDNFGKHYVGHKLFEDIYRRATPEDIHGRAGI